MNCTLRKCPTALPSELDLAISALGVAWLKHDVRPRLDAAVVRKWDGLISAWAANKELPLLVRKASKDRGSTIENQSGRIIVPTDNSPAQWVYCLAASGASPTMDELGELLKDDKVPVALALSAEERQRASRTCLLGDFSVNKRGWKLAHIHSIGLRSKQSLSDMPEQTLRKHFLAFLMPSNMFLIPSKWSGLAEVESFSNHFRHPT